LHITNNEEDHKTLPNCLSLSLLPFGFGCTVALLSLLMEFGLMVNRLAC